MSGIPLGRKKGCHEDSDLSRDTLQAVLHRCYSNRPQNPHCSTIHMTFAWECPRWQPRLRERSFRELPPLWERWFGSTGNSVPNTYCGFVCHTDGISVHVQVGFANLILQIGSIVAESIAISNIEQIARNTIYWNEFLPILIKIDGQIDNSAITRFLIDDHVFNSMLIITNPSYRPHHSKTASARPRRDWTW